MRQRCTRVCAAGISCFGPILGGDPDAMRDVMEVNFGPLRLVQAFGATLRRPGAGLIFVLSVASVALSRSSPGYNASKAAASARVELLQGPPGSVWDGADLPGVHPHGIWTDDVAAETARLIAAGWTLELAGRSPEEGYGSNR